MFSRESVCALLEIKYSSIAVLFEQFIENVMMHTILSYPAEVFLSTARRWEAPDVLTKTSQVPFHTMKVS